MSILIYMFSSGPGPSIRFLSRGQPAEYPSHCVYTRNTSGVAPFRAVRPPARILGSPEGLRARDAPDRFFRFRHGPRPFPPEHPFARPDQEISSSFPDYGRARRCFRLSSVGWRHPLGLSVTPPLPRLRERRAAKPSPARAFHRQQGGRHGSCARVRKRWVGPDGAENVCNPHPDRRPGRWKGRPHAPGTRGPPSQFTPGPQRPVGKKKWRGGNPGLADERKAEAPPACPVGGRLGHRATIIKGID